MGYLALQLGAQYQHAAVLLCVCWSTMLTLWTTLLLLGTLRLGSTTSVGWSEALQCGVCILQALLWCFPGSWGAARSGAQVQEGISDQPLVASLSRLTKATAEVVRSAEWLWLLTRSCTFSIAGEATHPRADCDLLWWDEPYNNKITSLPEGAGHHVCPCPVGPHTEHPLSPLPKEGACGDAGQVLSRFVIQVFATCELFLLGQKENI